jgi:predicted nucleic acid-binding protein
MSVEYIVDDYQFIDTNILVYAHDVSAGAKHEQAKTLLQSLWASRMGCLSIQVLQEFFVTITRKVPKPLPPQHAAQIIADLSVWRIHSPTAEDVIQAIDLQTRYQTSFWDSMILQSARRLNCKTVWSEDLSAGQMYYTVQVENPFVGG